MVTSGSEACVIFLHPIQQGKVTEGFELRLILFDSWVQLCQPERSSFQGALNVMNMTLSYVRNFLFDTQLLIFVFALNLHCKLGKF